MKTGRRRFGGPSALAVLGVVAAGMGCTSLLGIGGDFTVKGSGGSGGSTSSGPSTGGGGVGGSGGSPSSSSTSSAMGGSGGSGGGFVETGAITGHSVTEQLDDTGMPIDHQFVDFSAGSSAVLNAIFQKANGDWVTVSGIGAPGSDPDGNFSIPATIDGPYILQFGKTYSVMENRDQIDLDNYSVANFAVPTLSAGNDPLAQYNISGMRDWQANDILEFLQPDTGVYSFVNDPNLFNPAIMPGDNFVNSTAEYLALTYYDNHIIDPNTSVFLFHLSRYGSDPYQSIAGYAEVNFTVPDSNATFDVTASNFAIPNHMTTNRHVIIHNDQFGALAADFNPSAMPTPSTLNLSLQPVPYTVAGQIVGTADLAAADPFAPGTATINVDFFFGNPFPSTWQLAGDYRNNAAMTVQANGQAASQVSFDTGGCLIIDGDALLDPNHPLEPQVYPVTNAKIEGTSFFGAGATLASSTPKITWTAPKGPTPAEILVAAMPVVPDGQGGSAVEKFAGATTITVKGSATSVTLPPGFLVSGQEYLFQIETSFSPTANHEVAPGRIPATLCHAQVVSNKFTAH